MQLASDLRMAPLRGRVLMDSLASELGLERLGTPEDIAKAVAFLVGTDGSWINGQVLRANAGMV